VDAVEEEEASLADPRSLEVVCLEDPRPLPVSSQHHLALPLPRPRNLRHPLLLLPNPKAEEEVC